MQGFSTKLTAYDFLGLLIPGIVVTYYICSLFCNSIFQEISYFYSCGCIIGAGSHSTVLAQACEAIIFGVFSYIIGIIINCLSDLIFGRFRNNQFHISVAALLYKERQFGTPTNRRLRLVRQTIKIIWRSIPHIIGCRKVNYTSTEKRYYHLYYWLLNNNRLSDAVGVMEAQVAFVRNMFLPTLVVAIISFCKNNVSGGTLFIVLCFFELIVMLLRQMRIYYIVIEDYHWYKQMYDNDKRRKINNH
mgnify:CR=1 FL=1